MPLSDFNTTEVRTAALVVGLIIFLAFVNRWNNSSSTMYSKSFSNKLRSVVRQASQWHVTAKQDSNPLLSLMHSTYAVAYANLARAFASDEVIERITGLKISELMYYLNEDQQLAMQSLVTLCPSAKPEGVYAIGSGWL